MLNGLNITAGTSLRTPLFKCKLGLRNLELDYGRGITAMQES